MDFLKRHGGAIVAGLAVGAVGTFLAVKAHAQATTPTTPTTPAPGTAAPAATSDISVVLADGTVDVAVAAGQSLDLTPPPGSTWSPTAPLAVNGAAVATPPTGTQVYVQPIAAGNQAVITAQWVDAAGASHMMTINVKAA